jgi:hypothetical protein
MTTYKEIFGKYVKNYSSDPTSDAEGQVWYNTTSGTFKSVVASAAWSAGSPLIPARRYSGSAESVFDFDIKQIANKDFGQILSEYEEAELSDAFWNFSLPQSLDTSVASSPYFNVYLAAQVKANDKGFLSKDVLVSNLIELRGDIHHLFPKDYLKKNGLERGMYNQIANYVYMQSEINIKVGNKPPEEYFQKVLDEIEKQSNTLSGISNMHELENNLEVNCIPKEIISMKIENYEDFLALRRKLMAEKMKEYYFSL